MLCTYDEERKIGEGLREACCTYTWVCSALLSLVGVVRQHCILHSHGVAAIQEAPLGEECDMFSSKTLLKSDKAIEYD